MASRNNTFISMIIRDYSITAIEFSFKLGKLTLEGYVDQELPPGLIINGEIQQLDALQQFMGSLLSHSYPQTFEAGNVILSVNDQLTFEHVFEFTSHLSDKELINVIPLEAENAIPFSSNDIYWDHSVQSYTSGKQKVQFLAIPKTTADNYIQLFHNLDKEIIILTNFAEVYKSILQSEHNLAKNNNTLIIEFNHYKTYFHLFQDNILIQTKTAEIGLHGLLEEWAKINGIDVATLNDLLSTHNTDVLKPINYEKHFEEYRAAFEPICTEMCHSQGLTGVYYWGFAVRVPGFIEYLSKRLNINIKLEVLWKPIKLNKYFQNNKKVVVEINKNITDFGLVIAAGHNFISKMLSLKTLNLLPFELRKKAKTLLLFSNFYRVSILIITVSIALIFFNAYSLSTKYLELYNLQKETNNFEKLIYGKRYDVIRKDITNFNASIDQLYLLANQIDAIPKSFTEIALAPFEGIAINTLGYDRTTDVIKITGIAKNRQNLLDYQTELKDLAQPEQLDSPLSNFNNSEDILFEIILKLVKPKPWV